jgi:glycosyltransferase involved in cell wall biosynthesis
MQRSRRLYRPFLRKRLGVEAMRDLAKRQWSLPQARGIAQALRLFSRVFNSSEQELREWYPRFQMELLGRDASSGKHRLGYLVPEFPSQTHAFFWREIEALRGMGVQVSLYSSRRPAPGACRHDFAETAAEQTHYLFPPRWGASLLALAVRPIRSLRALAYVAGLRQSSLKRRLIYSGLLFSAADLMLSCKERNIQHVHAHSCADAAHVVALAHILGGPPYSLTLHGDLPVYGVDHASKMKPAKFVACVTTPLQRQVVEQVGLPVERAPVLWMGVETERFRADDNRAYLPRQLHIVTVARLNAMKGHRHALAAMKTARERGCDIRYTIAGEGPHRQEIEADIKRFGLEEWVRMAGTLSEGAVLELLQQADAFVLPSVGLGEAAPVSVMEAMACGLPVICSIIGGTPDMISSGVDGILIKQGDEQALADALVALAEDVAERRKLGERARERAIQSFDARHTARRLLDSIFPETIPSTAESTRKAT